MFIDQNNSQAAPFTKAESNPPSRSRQSLNLQAANGKPAKQLQKRRVRKPISPEARREYIRNYTQKRKGEGRVFIGIHLTDELDRVISQLCADAGMRKSEKIESLIEPVIKDRATLKVLLAPSPGWKENMPVKRISVAGRTNVTFDIDSGILTKIKALKADHSLSSAIERLCRHAIGMKEALEESPRLGVVRKANRNPANRNPANRNPANANRQNDGALFVSQYEKTKKSSDTSSDTFSDTSSSSSLATSGSASLQSPQITPSSVIRAEILDPVSASFGPDEDLTLPFFEFAQEQPIAKSTKRRRQANKSLASKSQDNDFNNSPAMQGLNQDSPMT